MYKNVLATRVLLAYYFVLYIVIVTLFVSNIFIGLVLAGMEDLRNQRKNDEIIAKCLDAQEQEFYSTALERKKELEKQRDAIEMQIHRINNLMHLRIHRKSMKSLSSVHHPSLRSSSHGHDRSKNKIRAPDLHIPLTQSSQNSSKIRVSSKIEDEHGSSGDEA